MDEDIFTLARDKGAVSAVSTLYVNFRKYDNRVIFFSSFTRCLL